MRKILKKATPFLLAAIMVCCAAALVACSHVTSDNTEAEKYTIEGVVASENGPLSGVSVKLGDETKTTGTAGNYAFEVEEGEYTLTFSKTGYSDVQESVNTADAVSGTVKRNVTMTRQPESPQPINIALQADIVALAAEDAEIKLGTNTFTYANGKWSLDGLTMAAAMELGSVDITLKNKYANIYADPSFTLDTSDYSGGKADKTITLTEKEILPGLKFSQMQNAKTLHSDYYVGKQAHRILKEFDKGGISAFTTQEQNEGDTLQVQSNLGDTRNEDTYYGYVYGQKTIGENTSTLTLCVRRHNNEATFSVSVIDMQTGAVWVSAKQTTNSEAYEYKTVDLSNFVGKHVVIAIGVYNVSGNENQFVLEHVRFFGVPAGGGKDDKFTKEQWANIVKGIATDELAYATAQTKTEYTGKDTKNIFTEWGYAAKSYADGESAIESVNEGFMMKTRQGKNDTSDNRAFIYNKFAITASNAYFTMTARSFDTAVDMALTVYYKGANDEILSEVIAPSTFTKANETKTVIELRSDNWIEFNCGGGYATFSWDLSEFEGKDVIIVIGCRNLTVNGDGNQAGKYESKLLVGNIKLEALPQADGQESN